MVGDVGPGRALGRRALTVVLACSGVAALAFQVIWERVVTLGSGVDLPAVTTVTAGFLLGLGLGSLGGGVLADRVGPIRATRWLGTSQIAVAVYGLVSVRVLLASTTWFATHLGSQWWQYAGAAAVIAVPAVGMGLSMPLAARIATGTVADAGPVLGRLSFANTAGAAFGAMLTGFLLIGNFGLTASSRLVSVALGGLGFAVRFAVRGTRDEPVTAEQTKPTEQAEQTEKTERTEVPPAHGSVAWWCLAYAAVGAAGIGVQQVGFRIAGSVLRSNAYSFSLLLAMYLVAWSLGSWWSARRMERGGDPRAWLARIVPLSIAAACGAVVILVKVMPTAGFAATFDRWFNSDGMAAGFTTSLGDVALYGLAIPALLIAVPAWSFGALYPLVQSQVTRRLDHVGRSAALVMASNLAGTVVGAFLTTFVLIDRFGSAGTLRALTVPLAVVGVAVAVGAVSARTTRLRLSALIWTVAVVAWTAMPSNDRLWSFIVGNEESGVFIAEDRSCATITELYGDTDSQLVIDGASQNNHPFDDFHILVGLVPSLAHPDPGSGLAIGFGVGSTTTALLDDARLDRVVTAELCGGAYELARRVAADRAPDLAAALADPRSDLQVTDGRHLLLTTDERFDVITVDTLRPTSSNAGSHVSVEFYELVDSRLTDDGVFSQWITSARQVNAAAQVFPYLRIVSVANYNSSLFMIASRSPLESDAAAMTRRFEAGPADRLPADQADRIRDVLGGWAPECVTDGRRSTGIPATEQNRDLEPRDEFFLNQRSLWLDRVVRTC